VLEDHVAFLFEHVFGVALREIVKRLLNDQADECTGFLFLPPVQDELPILQGLEQVLGDALDLFGCT
jgi:hypothetical protein